MKRIVCFLSLLATIVLACESTSLTPVPAVDPTAFRIVAGPEVKLLEEAGIFTDFTKAADGFPISVSYIGSVEMKLKVLAYTANDPKDVDAFWAASSIWLPGSYVVNKTSVMRTVTVFAVDPTVASELGWDAQTGIAMSDVIAGIRAGKIKLAMPSASQDDAGAVAYLAALSALKEGSETIRMSDLSDQTLIDQATTLFSAVERSTSRSDILRGVFVTDQTSVSPKYNALFVAESMAIAVNRDLVAKGATPLSVFYVKDAVGMETFPLGYTKSATPEKQQKFAALVRYLKSPDVQAKIQSLGFRTGYVGLQVKNADSKVFNPDWGIDTATDFVLIELPKDSVIDQALVLYQTVLRSGSYTVYCLDYSGSMSGSGETQLKSAMKLLLDQTEASKYLLQTSSKDVTYVIAFAGGILSENVVQGDDAGQLADLYAQIERQGLASSTNIYGCAIRALEVAQTNASVDQLPAVILLTDGAHNTGESYRDLEKAYGQMSRSVAVYGIVFGSAVEGELRSIAELTNGALCDGRGGQEALARCFREFKGSN